jgi:hypothetical protein
VGEPLSRSIAMSCTAWRDTRQCLPPTTELIESTAHLGSRSSFASIALFNCSLASPRSCITAFERFLRTKERTCPLCRKSSYEKIVTNQGTQAFRTVAATRIQVSQVLYHKLDVLTRYPC